MGNTLKIQVSDDSGGPESGEELRDGGGRWRDSHQWEGRKLVRSTLALPVSRDQEEGHRPS